MRLKVIGAFMLILLSGISGYSQSTVVEWTFPNNPDDAYADGGASYNLDKTITTMGGAGIPEFNQEGVTTNCVSAQYWANGALTKYWQIEFSTQGYGELTFEFKQASFSPQYFGPKDFLIQYRIGTSPVWTTITPFEITTGNHWYSLPPTSLPGTCDNQPQIFIRWLMLTNEATQGPGMVTNMGWNQLDDIRILSYCPVPLVVATPDSQFACGGVPIIPILLADTNGVAGTTFTWTRDNTAVLSGMPASGSGTPITGTLYTSNPFQLETTTFTITAEANGCSSTTTATVTVMDDSVPYFLENPDSVFWCVQDIVEAWWDGMGDITPDRPDYHTFFAGETTLDLDPATFADNCSPPEYLTLNWSIQLVGGIIITGSGQISTYPSNIEFPLGDNTIIYWLEDPSGNVTPEASRPVITVRVLARPDITRNF